MPRSSHSGKKRGENENEAFFLRIMRPGDYRYEGADIGILVTRGRDSVHVNFTRLDEGELRELIIATNATMEGEATAHYLAELAREREIPITRLAHGAPLGGDPEFVDAGTLAHAFASRRSMS